MGNKISLKRSVDPDMFKAFLKNHGTSIRMLAKEIDINEKTIRRAIDDREISLTVALILCDHFNVPCSSLFGPDRSEDWNRIMHWLMY